MEALFKGKMPFQMFSYFRFSYFLLLLIFSSRDSLLSKQQTAVFKTTHCAQGSKASSKYSIVHLLGRHPITLTNTNPTHISPGKPGFSCTQAILSY